MSPARLWPPNHQLVPVEATVTMTDVLSGPTSFTLTSATSSEPDAGLGAGDTVDDLQGFVLGTADTGGLVRAERTHQGPGRVYSLIYQGQDGAGNGATCTTRVMVPHDRQP